MPITEHQIQTLSDYIRVTGVIANNEKIWFRGLPDSDHTLQPSLFRAPFKANLETDFFTQFQSRAIPFLSTLPKDYWEWQFLMQHFGIPTRLLDWTSSGLAALAFAILFREDKLTNEKHFGKDAAIWCLDPLKLNNTARIGRGNKIPDISQEKEIQSNYTMGSNLPTYPVAISGPMNNERIVAQKGVFTLFPPSAPYNSLDSKDNAEEFLTKIVVKNADIVPLRKELYRMGMSESTLFPDLTHLAIELKRDLTDI